MYLPKNKNMPYVRRKPRYSSKSNKSVSFAKRVRKVINSTAQLKHASNTSAAIAMDANVLHFTSPTQNISQGTAINQRLGDQVKLKYLKVNGLFHAATLANACTKFRVSVFYCADGRAASSMTTGAFSVAELFQPNTAATTPTDGMYDEKYVSILADLVVDLNSNVSTAQDVKSFAFNVPLKNVTCSFKESGSAFAAKKNIYIMICGFTPTAANIADIGTYTYAYDLGFTDI